MNTTNYNLICSPIQHISTTELTPQANFRENCYFPGQMQPAMLWYHPQLNYFFTQHGYTILQSPCPSPAPTQNETYSNINSDQCGTQINNSFYSSPPSHSQGQPSVDVRSLKVQPQSQEGYLKIETVEKKQLLASKTKKLRKRQSDREYHPHKADKKEVRKRLHENENRNVIPNEINQIISFLQKQTKSGAILERLWKKYPAPDASYSLGRFYLYQRMLKERVGHYSNEASLKLLSGLYEPDCRVWSECQQRHYIKLSRVLVGHFLREDSIFIILTSKRMKSHKKLEHLRARRQVTRRVLQLLNSH